MRKLISVGIAMAVMLTMGFARVPSVLAAEPVPERIQAVLMIKVVSFIQKLGGEAKSDVTIGVLKSASAVSLLRAAAAKSLERITVKEVGIGKLEGIDILFVPIGTERDVLNQVKAIAKNAQILTVGGDPQYVLIDQFTLSFHLVGGKPRILLNIASGAEEGTRFKAKLLRIADLK